MNEEELLISRIEELSLKCSKNDYLTHTDYLSLPEISLFLSYLEKKNRSSYLSSINGVNFFMYGGQNENERRIIYFLPTYLSKEDFIEYKDEYSDISILHIYPKSEKFSDNLTHRDALGAIMNMGIKRSKIGDIFLKSNDIFVFCLKEIESVILEELIKIKHTFVQVEKVKGTDLDLSFNFEEKNINISSNRVDSIISEVFNISRNQGQELISNQLVFINNRVINSNSIELKNNEIVSVRGYGKFIFQEDIKNTRKGRLVCRVKIYC